MRTRSALRFQEGTLLGSPLNPSSDAHESVPASNPRASGDLETDRHIRPWPRQMRAETAAKYVDEASTSSFLRSIGTLYPEPRMIPAKGRRWLKEDLDEALDRLHGQRGDECPTLLADLV